MVVTVYLGKVLLLLLVVGLVGLHIVGKLTAHVGIVHRSSVLYLKLLQREVLLGLIARRPIALLLCKPNVNLLSVVREVRTFLLRHSVNAVWLDVLSCLPDDVLHLLDVGGASLLNLIELP